MVPELQTLSVKTVLDHFGGADKFSPYLRLLMDENTRVNLVSRGLTSDDIFKLVADSLVPFYLRPDLGATLSAASVATPVKAQPGGGSLARSVSDHLRYLDIGSGGGLPAIPILLVFPRLRGTLVERTGKKAAFLSKALKELKLDAHSLAQNFSESDFSDPKTGDKNGGFDLTTVRWVKMTKPLLRAICASMSPSGIIIYYTDLPSGVSGSGRFSETTTLRYRWEDDTIEYRSVSFISSLAKNPARE